MPQHLKSLQVKRVSLVDRAAVRDHANPTEPRRFVMFKSEDVEKEDDTATISGRTSAFGNGTEAPAGDALSFEELEALAVCLEDLQGDHPQLQALRRKIEAIARQGEHIPTAIKREDTHMSASANAQTAAAAAIEILKDHAADPDVRVLLAKADEIANPDQEKVTVAKFQGRVAELQKADSSLTKVQAMERVRKEDPALAREMYESTHFTTAA